MNNPVLLFVIPFLLVQVRSATIPANAGRDGGEGLQDLSPRFYLADNPNFRNSIVGASLKRNLEKLCDQCKQSPICRGKDECEHCVKYCQPYGVESKAQTSAEEVGIARKPENDFMRNKGEKDTTLVSRFADGNEMDEDGREELSTRLQMIHNPMAEEEEERTIVGNHRDPKIDKEFSSYQNHQGNRYYTVGLIKPGLLMNIILKLINVKQTNDMEKAVILVKSKKSLPITVGGGEKIDIEFLKMLGRELETAEKIHGGSPLDTEDINKILETAYEKAEIKSKTEAQIVSATDDSIPIIPSEQITRYDDKIVSSSNKMKPYPYVSKKNEDYDESPPAILHELLDETENDHSEDQEKTNIKQKNDGNMMVASQNREENLPEAMRYVGSARDESSKESEMKPQPDVIMESDLKDNLETKLEKKHDNMDSDSDESLEENEKARTFHHKKYKKKKKGHMPAYGSSYGNYNNHNGPSGYSRSNDDNGQQPSVQTNQGTIEALTGSQQGRDELSKGSEMKPQPHVTMVSDMKDNFETKLEKKHDNMDSDSDESLEENEKARTFHHKKYKKEKKGQIPSYGSSYGNYNNHNEPFGYSRSNDDNEQQPSLQTNQGTIEALTGSQQEGLRPLNEDRIGAKDDFQRDQKGLIYKGQGSLPKDLEKSQEARNDDFIGSRQESLRPLNEERIGAKEDFEREQKGSTYKGQGGLLKDLETSHKTRDDDLIGLQQESLRPLNEDRIGAKDDFQRDQKGLTYKGQGNLQNLAKSQKTRNDGEKPDSLKLLDSKDTREDFLRDSNVRTEGKDAAYRNSDGIAKIHLSEQNKMLDPKEVAISQPNEDSHDGMPDPFHTRLHAHFNKIQEYFNKQSGTSSGKSEPIVGMTESSNLNVEDISPDIQMKTRNNDEEFHSQSDIKTENIQMTESREAREEPIDDMPKVGINFQPDDLINLQMAKDNDMNDPTLDDMPKVGMNIEPTDLTILQKKKENSNKEDKNSEGATEMRRNNGDLQMSEAAENFDGEFSPQISEDAALNDIAIAGDLKNQQNPMNRPQFTSGDQNLPGQTIIQVDDQLIDVPNEGKSIFQVNSKPMAVSTDDDDREQDNIFINQSGGDMGDGINVGAMNVLPSENLRVNPQVMIDQSGQNLGLSANRNDITIVKKHPIMYTGNEDTERSSTIEKKVINNEEFPTPKTSPIRKQSFAPAFAGSRTPKVIQTGSEQVGSSTGELEEMAESSTQNIMEIVGNERVEYENAIEKKIEKLMTPREQEFLHNFGKIVPSIERMHLNSKSDIYFMGNGIKLPLKMAPNKDGTISLSVDLEKLCKCKNSTCSHRMDMINKLDGNLMDISNDLDNSQLSVTEKNENDKSYMENSTEKKIRKPRNHMDLSKLYKTYRKKYHRLHRRSVSNEYFNRFKVIEQGLEKKLGELNENVEKSNREYDNMLRKGTKDLLKIKEEDQVVKQRIELVNDLLKWMKEMASEITNVEDRKLNGKEFYV